MRCSSMGAPAVVIGLEPLFQCGGSFQLQSCIGPDDMTLTPGPVESTGLTLVDTKFPGLRLSRVGPRPVLRLGRAGRGARSVRRPGDADLVGGAA
jgi:hypothetical protein